MHKQYTHACAFFKQHSIDMKLRKIKPYLCSKEEYIICFWEKKEKKDKSARNETKGFRLQNTFGLLRNIHTHKEGVLH